MPQNRRKRSRVTSDTFLFPRQSQQARECQMSQNRPSRPVPGLARGPSSFTPKSSTPISMPVGMASAPPIQIPPQVAQIDSKPLDAEDLAMEIYARLVVGHLGRSIQPPDPMLLRQLAQTARTSAQIYFQLDSEDNHE